MASVLNAHRAISLTQKESAVLQVKNVKFSIRMQASVRDAIKVMESSMENVLQLTSSMEKIKAATNGPTEFALNAQLDGISMPTKSANPSMIIVELGLMPEHAKHVTMDMWSVEMPVSEMQTNSPPLRTVSALNGKIEFV